MMDDITTIAHALNGRRNGDGWLCRCPVPTHGKGKGDRNPSLSIRQGDDRLLVHCFGGCDSRDVLDVLRRHGFLEDRSRNSSRPRWRSTPRRPAPAPEHKPDPDALALWRAATPALALVRTYLRARGLVIEPPPSIRFLDAYRRPFGPPLPAMVAAVQRPDGRVVGVQVTLLDPSGTRKANVKLPRINVGALGEGAVRLAAVDIEMGIAEGVEDALGAMQLTGAPCWAGLGSARLHRVAIPTQVRTLHLFADDDEAGHKAAERVIDRHHAEGRRVIVRRPPQGVKDWAAFAEIGAVELEAVG